MTRRSKSNKCGAFFTYHERNNIRHGTERRRLPGGAMKEWHQCSICLSTPRDAVLTPEGILYDREAIVKALLSQKQAARTQHELQVKREQLQRQDEARKERARVADEARRDERIRDQISTTASLPAGVATGRGLTGNGGTSSNAQQNFWMPGAEASGNSPSHTHGRRGRDGDVLAILAPTMKRRKGTKTVFKTRCPVTNNPLRMRDLISLTLHEDKAYSKGNDKKTVRNGPAPEGEGSVKSAASGESGEETERREKKETADDDDDDEGGGGGGGNRKRTFVCPVCHIMLTNSAKPLALRTGTVLCTRCVDDFVQKDGTDPCTSQRVTIPDDVITINNSGTGFAGSAPDDPASKEGCLYRPSVT